MRSLALTLALSLGGCSWFVSDAVKEQIQVEVVIHERVLELWPALTPEERLQAYQASARGWAAQAFNVFGEENPALGVERPGEPD